MNVRQEARQGTVIDGTTRVAGVIGDPVAHTLSPPMHNAAFASQGLGWVYVPFRVAPEHLGEAVRAVAQGKADVVVDAVPVVEFFCEK